jgi:two-component system, cell cycle sensor histidine kinase and response regulator CckA
MIDTRMGPHPDYHSKLRALIEAGIVMGTTAKSVKMGKQDLIASTAVTDKPKPADLRNELLAQKSELIGELAGAIANQFNNIMMAVTGYAELELKKAGPGEKRSLEQIVSNAARATSLIQKLLAFSRKQAPSPQRLELNTVAASISDLLRQLVGEQVEVVFDFDPNVQSINADAGELEQLILGLALNSRNAMTAGGELTVSTQLVKLDKEFVGASDGARPGDYAMLSVCDTPVRSAEGKTNGTQDLRISIALATARKMVEDAHGLMRISSERNGASFKVYFPALEKSVPAHHEESSPRNIETARTILVVEDDDAVRIPAAEFLMMEGFKVLQARTGAEALHVVSQIRSPLDLLITDIMMPEMSGHQVAAKLNELHPGLKVLYMSGDASEAASSQTAGMPRAILQKPFRLNKLKNKIHEVLGQ